MDVIPSIFNKRAAKGEGYGGANVALGERYSRNGVDRFCGRIGWFGRNLSAYCFESSFIVFIGIVKAVSRRTSAFGVFSV